jgi:hypothetical protein
MCQHATHNTPAQNLNLERYACTLLRASKSAFAIWRSHLFGVHYFICGPKEEKKSSHLVFIILLNICNIISLDLASLFTLSCLSKLLPKTLTLAWNCSVPKLLPRDLYLMINGNVENVEILHPIINLIPVTLNLFISYYFPMPPTALKLFLYLSSHLLHRAVCFKITRYLYLISLSPTRLLLSVK